LFKGKNVWVKKLKVTQSQEPFDYLVLTPTENMAVEVKEWKSKGKFYPKHRIAPHQIAGLERFQSIGKHFKSYFFINIVRYNQFLIPYMTFDCDRSYTKDSFMAEYYEFLYK